MHWWGFSPYGDRAYADHQALKAEKRRLCGWRTRWTTFGGEQDWHHGPACDAAAESGEPRPCGQA